MNKKKKQKKQQAMDLEDQNNSKKPKNSNGRKTYFRIKSAGNARPEKMPSKYRPT